MIISDRRSNDYYYLSTSIGKCCKIEAFSVEKETEKLSNDQIDNPSYFDPYPSQDATIKVKHEDEGNFSKNFYG